MSMTKTTDQTVLVAMSGGVDSSTALHKILEAGYQAIGVTMKLWQYRDSGGNLVADSNCCSISSINNARLVCEQFGVPHYTLDHQPAFRRSVVNNFVDEYLAGRTPNPCVRCNTFLKWGSLLEQAREMGADLIATGHYARIDNTADTPRLLKGRDPLKDQSYFLWGIDRATLARTIFPLGDLTKTAVRTIAGEQNLPNADEPESQEICFIPDNDYRRFLNDYAPERSAGSKAGNFIDENGKILGTHRGIAGFTVGQRRGLGIAGPEPYYVQRIDPVSGDITLATRAGVTFRSCRVGELNLLAGEAPHSWRELTVQIRYNHPGVAAIVIPEKNSSLRIEFAEPQFAVAPGQSAVFYRGDQVLGGGIITEGIVDE